MTKKRKHPRGWTDEEIEILRFQWESGHPVKTWMHLLPNRTERAIRTYGSAELGLPPRGNGRTPGNSMTWSAIQRVLADGIARDVNEIARLTGLSSSYVMQELRMHYPASVHIGGYGVRANGHGYRPRLWRLGSGKDAPRPKAMTPAERARKRWRMLKEERPDYIETRNAKYRLRNAEKQGKLIRRDPAAAWI